LIRTKRELRLHDTKTLSKCSRGPPPELLYGMGTPNVPGWLPAARDPPRGQRNDRFRPFGAENMQVQNRYGNICGTSAQKPAIARKTCKPLKIRAQARLFSVKRNKEPSCILENARALFTGNHTLVFVRHSRTGSIFSGGIAPCFAFQRRDEKKIVEEL